MNNSSYVRWIAYIFFSLFFAYQVLTSTSFLMRYVSLLCCILDLTMFIVELGIYNYHKGNLKWLDE
jgi:hypothetical protein